MPARTDPEWMTPAEAAAYLGCGRTTLWSLRKRRVIRAARVGRFVRYRRSGLDAALAKRER